MSSTLISLVIALALGGTVVVLGRRRNLSEVTRNGLPKFGGDTEGATTTLGLYEGQEVPRRPLSLRQRIGLVVLYALLALSQAADAVLSSDGRLLHAAFAVVWVVAAAVFWLRSRAD